MDIRTLAARGFDLWSPVEATTSSGIGKGYLEIEPGWALCAVPIEYGYWDSSIQKHVHDGVTVAKFKNYILDQIDDLYGPGMIEVSNTYVGGVGSFYTYVPGSTPETSFNNFQLMYSDGPFMEISGFFIKSVNSNNMLISWGE